MADPLCCHYARTALSVRVLPSQLADQTRYPGCVVRSTEWMVGTPDLAEVGNSYIGPTRGGSGACSLASKRTPNASFYSFAARVPMACLGLLNVRIEAIQDDAPSITYVFSISLFFRISPGPPNFSKTYEKTKRPNRVFGVQLESKNGRQQKGARDTCCATDFAH